MCFFSQIIRSSVQISDTSRTESLPSETVVAWTDPIIGAVAEPPKVTPFLIRHTPWTNFEFGGCLRLVLNILDTFFIWKFRM